MAVQTQDRSTATIMVVEDDPAVARTLTDALETSSFRVWVAETGAEARTVLHQTTPDLVVLDLMLPDVDGLLLCSEIRTASDVPVVICSATPHERDRILGLKFGADDFIAKPFDIYDLEARIQAVLRRTYRTAAARPVVAPANEVRVGALTIDRARRRATLGHGHIPLTPTEYKVLVALAGSADQIVSRRELASSVWGFEDASSGRTIDVYIRRLRAKLSAAPGTAPAILAVRGFGYRIVAPRSNADSERR